MTSLRPSVFREIFDCPPSTRRQLRQATVGRPDLGQQLSTGSTCHVYQDRREGPARVVKKIDIGPAAIAEITLMLSVNHPNLMKILQIDYSAEGIMIALPKCRTTLSSRLNSVFSPEEVRRTLVGILRGTAYLHMRGILHCDIKSDNIYVDNDGAGGTASDETGIIIGDFGISMLDVGTPLMHLIQTPTHRAPEVIVGAVVTPAIDLWSIGVCALEMLGTRCIIDTNDGTAYAAHFYGIQPRSDRNENITNIISSDYKAAVRRKITLYQAGLPAALIDVVAKLLDYYPTGRGSASMALGALDSSPPRNPGRILRTTYDDPVKEVSTRIMGVSSEARQIYVADGSTGIAKCICGRIPTLTEREKIAAMNLSKDLKGKAIRW